MSPEGPAGSPTLRWGLGDVWVALGLYLALALVAGSVVLALPDRPDPQAWGVLAVLTLPWLGLAGWPVLATVVKGRGPVRDLRLRARPGQLVLGTVAGFVGLFAAGVVAVAVERLLDSPLESSVGRLADELTDASPVVLVLLAVLAGFGAPVVEEIAFRGLMFGALVKRGMSQRWAVVTTAAAFAAFHLEPSRFPVLLVIGLLLGWVRAHTGSTGASMAAHAANNLPGAIALLLLAFD